MNCKHHILHQYDQKKAGRIGESQDRGAVRVMNEVRKRQVQERGQVRLVRVKAHVGIPGNERANERAKLYTRREGPEVLTEGEFKQQLVARRKAERA